MDVLTSETCWALNKEIIKQVTSSWSLFIQLRLLKFPHVVAPSPSLKHKKDCISLRDVLLFSFHDEVHKHLLTCQTSTPHWGIAQPCYCKWGWRKDQGQRLSALADCSSAFTVMRKLISLFYCWTSYIAALSWNIQCLQIYWDGCKIR